MTNPTYLATLTSTGIAFLALLLALASIAARVQSPAQAIIGAAVIWLFFRITLIEMLLVSERWAW